MRPAADLVLLNGRIYRGDPSPRAPRLAPHHPVAANLSTHDSKPPTALAVKNGRILDLGSNEEMRDLLGSGTRVIDAQDCRVIPGFNDAHVHFLAGGFQLSSVDLGDADTPEELARRIGDFAARNPDRWVTGGRWDHERWEGAALPTRTQIDPVTPHTPVFVSRLDGHMALANSVALRLAGVTHSTPNPPGGVIVRDPRTGEPTGVLKDAAMELIYAVMPSRSFAHKREAARAATKHAASLGVTSVQDMSTGSDSAVFQDLLAQGELKTRIYGVWPIPRWEQLAQVGFRAPFGNDFLRLGGLKGFSDGSLGSSTALFFEPYSGEPDNCGLFTDEMLPEGVMLERVLAADRLGLHVMIHAIGDRANAEVLSIYEQVVRENGPRDRRFRIEHAQHLRPQDLPRFTASGIIASVQPVHAADDGRWAEKRLGRDRCRTTYPFRSLLDSGAVLACGTDWPVAPLDPLPNLDAAVHRRTLDGRHPDGWIPEERITLEEALHAYTVGSAYAEFTDNVKGTLHSGMLADLVLLSEDPFSDPEQLSRTRVAMTIVGGEVVYERSLC